MKSLPPPCRPGDKVAIVAPSGPFQRELLHEGCELLREWGLEPIFGPSLFEGWGYLAGRDRDRAEGITAAFAQPDVKAVICARGGYGAARLMDDLPWSDFAAQPRRFLGFSDITLLHLGFAKRCEYITFHAPMAASRLFFEGSPDSVERVKRALFGERIEDVFPPLAGRCLQQGKARGPLLGGNLALLCTSLGTPWQPDFNGAILALEDVGEPPYRIDRMLQHLRMAGALSQIAGLVIGDFGVLTDQYTTYHAEAFWRERLALPAALPVLYEVPFGHIRDNATLPLGAEVSLDATAGTLRVVP